jgi:hypothetical protein
VHRIVTSASAPSGHRWSGEHSLGSQRHSDSIRSMLGRHGRRTVLRSYGLTGSALLVLLVAMAMFVFEATTHTWFNGDTVVLIGGLSSISRCLGNGVLLNCNRWLAQRNVTAVSKFPLTQQAPGYVFHELGLSNAHVQRALAYLNAVVIIGFVVVVVVWSYRRRGLVLAVLAGVLLVPGMLLPYAGQSFGEPLGIVAFGLVALTGLRKDKLSPFLAVAALVATMSKETAAPLVLLFGLAAIGLSGARVSVMRRAAIALVTGILVGVMFLAAMNEFRYGTLLNRAYLSEARSSLSMIPNNILGMLISPNAGIAWFWPGVMVAVIVLGWTAARPHSEGPRRPLIRLSAAVGVATFLLSIVSLSYWWDPFGWYAWGPRLLLPSCGAVIVLALSVIGRSPSLGRWVSPASLGAFALVSGLILLPSEAIVLDNSAYTSQIVATWSDHPICSPAITVKSQKETNMCYRVETWRTTSIPLVEAVRGEDHNSSFWTLFGLSWASVCLWLFIARSSTTPAGTSGQRRRGTREPILDTSEERSSNRAWNTREEALRFGRQTPDGLLLH